MDPKIKKWSDAISTVLFRARTVNDALYSKPQSDTDTPWHLSKDGLRLHDAIEHAFTATVAIWNDPFVCAWTDENVESHSLLTQSLLEALTMDYVYRTNNAPPSDPLWRNLEAKLDMPAELDKLQAGWADRSANTAYSFDHLRRVLALTALCRPDVAYTLIDSPRNQTIWQDMKELKHYWICKNILLPPNTARWCAACKRCHHRLVTFMRMRHPQKFLTRQCNTPSSISLPHQPMATRPWSTGAAGSQRCSAIRSIGLRLRHAGLSLPVSLP